MARTASNVITKLSADTTNFEQGMKRARKQSNDFGNTSKKVDGQLRLMRGGFGQVGHQIQDVAVQLQMGQNAMLVFGQQGSQIASLFGPGGAMIGAVLAVGAALSMALMPKLFGATEAAKELKTAMGELSSSFDTLTTAQKAVVVKDFTQKIDDNNEIIDANNEKLKGLRQQLKKVNEQNNQTAEQQKKSNNELMSYVGIAPTAIRANVEQGATADQLKDSINQLQGEVDTATAKNVEYKKVIDNTTTAFENQEASLEKQIDTFGKSAHAIRVYGIEADLAAKKITDGEAQKLIAQSLTLESLEKNAERQKQLDADRKKAQKDIAKEADKAFKEQERTAQRFADTIGRGFTQAITGAMSFKDAMKNVAASVINDLTAMMVKKMITDQIFGALMDTSFFGGGSSGASQISKTQPSSTVNSKIGRHAYEGGGFTGFGARSGGVDGRGGFPAILHPNETVIDHTKGQGMGAVVNQTINVTTGVQQTVRAEIQNLMPQIQEAAKAAVADSRARGGSYSKALVGR